MAIGSDYVHMHVSALVHVLCAVCIHTNAY